MSEFILQHVSHRRGLGADSQTTQDISLVTEGPDRDLLHPALGQAWHQRDVTQWDGWDLLPRTSQRDLTLPVRRICFNIIILKLKRVTNRRNVRECV